MLSGSGGSAIPELSLGASPVVLSPVSSPGTAVVPSSEEPAVAASVPAEPESTGSVHPAARHNAAKQ